MSPRNFEKIYKLPKPIYDDKVIKAPNLWYAFTAVTHLDRLFSYTADEITNKTINDEVILPAHLYEED